MWTNRNSEAIQKKLKMHPSLSFALKSELKYRPVKFLTILTLLTIILLG